MAAARPLRDDELDQVVDVVVAAFEDYPYWQWLLADPIERAATMRAYYAADLAPMLEASWGLDDGDGRLVGVALWARSDAWAGLVDAPSTADAGRAAPRMAAALAAMADLAPAAPHWYLDVLAVRPTHQGNGIGRVLLRPGLARAEAAGVACYLETGRPVNVRFYETEGFVVSGECDVTAPEGPAGALHLWGMWRPAPTPPGRDHL